MKLRHNIASCTRLAVQAFLAAHKWPAIDIPTLATSPHSFSFVVFFTVPYDHFLFSDFCFSCQCMPCSSPSTLVWLYSSRPFIAHPVLPTGRPIQYRSWCILTTLSSVVRCHVCFSSCCPLSFSVLFLYQAFPYPLANITVIVFKDQNTCTVTNNLQTG